MRCGGEKERQAKGYAELGRRIECGGRSKQCGEAQTDGDGDGVRRGEEKQRQGQRQREWQGYKKSAAQKQSMQSIQRTE